MKRTMKRMGQARHVVPKQPEIASVLESVLTKYLDRANELFNSPKTLPVSHNLPERSLQFKMMSVRACVLELGVARTLEHWGGDVATTEACKIFLDEALILRKRLKNDPQL